MIILKILLFIILAVVGLILLILIAPVGAEVSFIDGKFSYSVKASFLNVMNSKGGGVIGWLKKRKKKPKKEKPVNEKKEKKKKFGKKKSVVNDDDFLEDFDFDEPDDIDFEKIDDDEEFFTDESNDNDNVIGFAADDEKTEEKKHRKPKKDKKKKSDDEPKEKRTLSDWIELLIGIWESAQRPLLKIFKGFHFSDLYIDFIIANEDAYKCALNYGKISGSVYNILGFMSTLFTVRLKTVDINPKFAENKSRWDCSCRIYFRAGTMVIAGLWFLITYLFRTFIPNKIEKSKLKRISRKAETR